MGSHQQERKPNGIQIKELKVVVVPSSNSSYWMVRTFCSNSSLQWVVMLCCSTSWLKPVLLISQHTLCFSCSHTHFSRLTWCWCAHRRQHILPPFLFFIFHTLHWPLGFDFFCSKLVNLNTFFLPYMHFQSVSGKVWSLKIACAKIYSDSKSTERRKNYYKMLLFFFSDSLLSGCISYISPVDS